jgi:hypothetical protein
MPERVTRKEREISLLIEKAREVKETLYQSMYDNNRSPAKDESEVVKVKRPKAEKADKITNEAAGEMTEFKKALTILKQILESDYEDNPIWNKERVDEAEKAVVSTTKELQMLLDKYKKDGDIKSFNQSAQERIRQLTDAMQVTEDPKVQAKPLVPSANQYR